jgi:hypothetical protein
MAIKKIVQKDGAVEFHLLEVDSWDEFDSLARYVEKEFDGKVVEKMDEVFTRKWTFDVQGELVVLRHHEDVGNYFDGSEKCEVLRRIVADLDERLD